MFYTLSKALLFLLQPTVWIIAIVILALLTRSRRRRRRLSIAGFLLFMLFGNQVLYNWTLEEMETPVSSEAPPVMKFAVVLGGFGEYNAHTDMLELSRSADRLTEALALYHERRIEKIIISSGVHEDGHPEWNESKISKQFLIRSGVAAQDVITEERSWNTFQNAQYTAAILSDLNYAEEVLLITSAFHMKRAVACFEKQGVSVRPYPVDFISDRESVPWTSYLIPSLRYTIDWQIPIKEKVGMLVYRLKGYI